MRQVEMFGIHHGSLHDVFSAGLHAFLHGLVVDVEVGDAYFRLFVGVAYPGRVETGDSVCPSEDKFAFLAGEGGSFAKLVSLQSVACMEVDEASCIRVEAADAVVGADPEIPVRVFLDAADEIAG